MANINTSGFAAAIKTFYERRLLMRAFPRLLHGRWLDQARLNKAGSWEARKYGALGAVTSTLTEGTTPAEQDSPSLSVVTITPSWYGAFVSYTDEIDMVEFDPYVSEVSAILGEQCGLSADTIIRDYMVANSTIDYSHDKAARTDLVAPNDNITYKDLLMQIAAAEADGMLPADGMFFPVIIHPHTFATLMQDPIFVNMFVQEDAGVDPIRTGYIGRILRMKFYMSSNVKEYVDGGANGTDDVYTMIIVGKESMGIVGFGGTLPSLVDNGGEGGGPLTGKSISPVSLIGKPLGSAGANDPLNQRGTIAWKMSLGIGVLNSAWIRVVEHTNEFSVS
jgi:N4-gp56 family major capsid protein